jgi:adenosine deaminase CECR1
MKTTLTILLFALAQPAAADWFEDLKASATPQDLYRVLYYMPKGGDLHNHLSGSNFSEWWYELALLEKKRGYHYYTKVRIENCAQYGANSFGPAPYYLMFRNISAHEFNALGDCEKREYKRLEDLDETEKSGWFDSIRLDKPFEGRDEFFQTHWPRLNALTQNPWLQAEMLVRNMQAFGAEGVRYLEPQVAIGNFEDADGSTVSPEQTAEILRQRLRQPDAIATGVTVRFQVAILRFAPSAEGYLRRVYEFVDANNDLFVAVNFVGREDNDKGYPLRFLQTLRELRHNYGGVKLSIHAGEVDEPNYHVRDTLLLGADRIGHGLNLITDSGTMLLMRHGPYLIEINLISNLLLDYVDDYSQHPFPEYLRTGIPVALSTDDRGMWDSNLTDEFFVAVTEFDLSWDEVTTLSRNSLRHAFLEEPLKQELLQDLDARLAKFGRDLQKHGLSRLGPPPSNRQFVCTRYGLCN